MEHLLAQDSFSLVVVENDFASCLQCLGACHVFAQDGCAAEAMYGVYDGHGPAGHDCSDLSLRRG